MTLPVLGVVVVTFETGEVVFDCLESLLAAKGVQLAIVVVDNASPDATPALIRDWASGQTPWTPPEDLPLTVVPAPKPLAIDGRNGLVDPTEHRVTLVEADTNGGYAAGVNLGLARLAAEPEIDRFWVLNPDGVVPPDVPRTLATVPGEFSLLGGRVLYLDGQGNDRIQFDGGVLRRTGVSASLHKFGIDRETRPPDPARLDFVSGAHMVASRAFYEAAGPMPEDYFLYYEEVDWAMRRGDMPFAWCPEATIWHRAGTSIGSGRPDSKASHLSTYFLHRGRLRFVRRHFPRNLPVAVAFSVFQAARLAARGEIAALPSLIAGSFGLGPPAIVRNRLSPEAQALAFS